MKSFVLRLIQNYQDKGGSQVLLGIKCVHEVTCSQYTKNLIQDKGLIYGLFKGFIRILKCK